MSRLQKQFPAIDRLTAIAMLFAGLAAFWLTVGPDKPSDLFPRALFAVAGAALGLRWLGALTVGRASDGAWV